MSLQNSQESEKMNNLINVSFTSADQIKQLTAFPRRPEISTGQILVGFLRFYSQEFKPDSMAIDISQSLSAPEYFGGQSFPDKF